MSGICCQCKLLQTFKYSPWRKVVGYQVRFLAHDTTYDNASSVNKDNAVAKAKSKLARTRSRRKPTTRDTSQKVGLHFAMMIRLWKIKGTFFDH